jgi:hypothetical protein
MIACTFLKAWASSKKMPFSILELSESGNPRVTRRRDGTKLAVIEDALPNLRNFNFAFLRSKDMKIREKSKSSF